VGRAAVAEFLTGDFAANPGRESNWQAERVEVAASGDLAVEYGSYTSGGADGVVVEEGNYTTVYRKAAGGWVILSDSSVPNAIPGAAAN
jgi:ketosteroid isomerase-like protein